MNTFKLTYPKDTLNIDAIANSGQCFRWRKVSLNVYVSPVNRYFMKVRNTNNKESEITLYSDLSDDKARKYIYKYFNLDIDYKKIISSIDFDPYVKVALESSYGLRVLKHDPLETIFSFILSQNNTVGNVTKCIERISKKISLKNKDYFKIDGEIIYLFPSVFDLANLSIKEYEDMKCGYRSRYMNSAAEKIVKENIDLNKWSRYKPNILRKKLLSFDGIGEKVADCIMLYSMGKSELVPMDTWVQKASIELYGLKKNCTNKEVREFFVCRFGEYAGWAHQLIFSHARKYSKRGESIKESFRPLCLKGAINIL